MTVAAISGILTDFEAGMWQRLTPTTTTAGRADGRSNSAARSEVPGFFVLHSDHNETVGRHGRAGFRAIPEFEQSIDIRGGKFPAPNVEQRAHHLAHHVTKERT